MKFRLNVDSEFKRLIPPLSENEYKELEKSLIAEGCRDPIVIWNGLILDGHNRYAICRHYDLHFRVRSLTLESRDEAIAWICTNQIGRRNITEATRQYLIGKRFEAEKRIGVMNPEGYNQHISKQLSPQNEGNPLEPLTKYGISSKIGREYGIAHSTVERYGRFAQAVDHLGNVSTKMADSILSGSLLVQQRDVIDMVDLSEQQIKAISDDIPPTPGFRLSRDQIVDSIRTVKRPVEQIAHPRTNTELTTITVKDMPDYDPDAEVASLTLTMPSWRSSINRVRNNNSVGNISEKARAALHSELLALKATIETMIELISEG